MFRSKPFIILFSILWLGSWERISLGNESLKGIEPISILIKGVDEDAKKIGIHREFLKSVIEDQFNLAKIPMSKNGNPPQIVLYVTVVKTFGNYAASYRLHLRNWVYLDPTIQKKVLVTTWEMGGLITDRKKKLKPQLEEAIVKLAQDFIHDYYSVNPQKVGLEKSIPPKKSDMETNFSKTSKPHADEKEQTKRRKIKKETAAQRLEQGPFSD